MKKRWKIHQSESVSERNKKPWALWKLLLVTASVLLVGGALFLTLWIWSGSSKIKEELYDVARTTVTFMGALTVGAAAYIQYRKHVMQEEQHIMQAKQAQQQEKQQEEQRKRD